MTLIEALKSGKPYRKVGDWQWYRNPFSEAGMHLTQFNCDDVLADYEIKLVPPTPRTIWVNEYPEGLSCRAYSSKEEANRWAGDHIRLLEFREVIEQKE